MEDTADDHHPVNFHHGDQDATQQTQTYHLFNALTKWASLLLAVLMVVLTLWFCVGSGFLGGLVPGLLVLAAGIYFLRSKPSQEEI